MFETASVVYGCIDMFGGRQLCFFLRRGRFYGSSYVRYIPFWYWVNRIPAFWRTARQEFLKGPGRNNYRNQEYGGWITSGSEFIYWICPQWPGCPPGFLPESSLRLCVFLGRLSSFEGGIELLPLFLGFRNRANSLSSCTIRDFRRLILPRSFPFTFTRTWICLSLLSNILMH